MIRRLRKIPFRSQSIRTIGIYTAAGFLNKGIAFLFLPLLTAYLQPADYGIVTLFSNAILFIAPFINLSVVTSVSTDFFKHDKDSFRKYFSSILLLPLFVTVIILLIIMLFGRDLSVYFNIPVHFLYTLPVLALATFFFELLLTLVRNRNEPMSFAALTSIKTVLELALSAALIIGIGMTWQGRIWGWLITSVLVIIYALYNFNKNGYLTRVIDRGYLRDELKYSVPIIINQFAIFSVMASDKFFLAKYYSVEQVGIYGVAGQIAFIAFAFSSALIMSFNPYLYKTLSEYNEEKKKEVIRKIVKFTALLLLICIGIAAITPLLYHFFINPKYHSGATYVKWMLLAYFFWFVYWMLLGFLYFYKLKKVIVFISLLSFVLAVALNFFLIPAYGITGALYSLNISCFVAMAVLLSILKYRFKFI